MQLTFKIPNAPVAKGRPRFRIFKGFVSSYTPSKTREAEKAIEDIFKESYPDFNKPLSGPLRIKIYFYMPVPASLSKKKREAILAQQMHIKKPDCDNLAKTVCDALNGVVWEDDSQVCEMYITKRYALTPCTYVCIEDI